MLRIQNTHVDWERQQIAIPATNAEDGENRPFEPDGWLAPILKRRAELGPSAFVFGTAGRCLPGEVQVRLGVAAAHRAQPRSVRQKPGGGLDRVKLRQIDLTWHDLRHEGACRLLADGVDIRSGV